MARSPLACCQLCNRQTGLTFHHLVPRKVHRRARFRKHFTREQLNTGLWICSPCHKGVHRLYDEMTLATLFDSRDKLLADPAIQRHVQWVAKQRIG